jgi:hypothetical protein
MLYFGVNPRQWPGSGGSSPQSKSKRKIRRKIMKAAFRVVLLVGVMTVGWGAVAQNNGAVTSKDKKMTMVPAVAGAHTPYVDDNVGSTVIFSNLATEYPNGLYWCCQGATVSGPYSPGFVEWWHAAAFTPSADATATKVTVSIGYLAGAGSIILSLNADNGGIPGTVLEQWTLGDLGQSGTCCSVQSKKVSGIALTAGQQYWIVATTKPHSSVWAAWNVADSDQVDNFLNAGLTNQQGNPVWESYMTNINVAFAVYGQ